MLYGPDFILSMFVHVAICYGSDFIVNFLVFPHHRYVVLFILLANDIAYISLRHYQFMHRHIVMRKDMRT